MANSEYQLIHLLLNGRVELIVADLEVLKASVYKSLLSNRDKKKDAKSASQWQSILEDINTEIANMHANNEFDSFIKNKKQQCYNLG